MHMLNYHQIRRLEQDLDIARQYRDHLKRQRDQHTEAMAQLEVALREAECDLDDVMSKLLISGWEG